MSFVPACQACGTIPCQCVHYPATIVGPPASESTLQACLAELQKISLSLGPQIIVQEGPATLKHCDKHCCAAPAVLGRDYCDRHEACYDCVVQERPPFGAWATDLCDIRSLLHPEAPKGSVILERLDKVLNDIQAWRSKKPITKNFQFLLDLAEKLRYVPGTYGIDDGDIDELIDIAITLETP